MFGSFVNSKKLADFDPEKFDYVAHMKQLIANISTMPEEQRKGIDPKFIASIVGFLSLPAEKQQKIGEDMKATARSAQAAGIAMQAGFPCSCGGTKHYAMSRALRYNPDRHVMYDAYDIKCDKCGDMSVFAVDLPHLQDDADAYKARGVTEDYEATRATYKEQKGQGKIIEFTANMEVAGMKMKVETKAGTFDTSREDEKPN